MQLTAELADEFAKEYDEGHGRGILLANGVSGNGQNLYRGTVIEVTIANSELCTVKYTIDEYAFGSIDDADKAEWHESNGLATWTNLRLECELDNGALSFNEPTRAGSTARIAAPVAALAAA